MEAEETKIKYHLQEISRSLAQNNIDYMFRLEKKTRFKSKTLVILNYLLVQRQNIGVAMQRHIQLGRRFVLSGLRVPDINLQENPRKSHELYCNCIKVSIIWGKVRQSLTTNLGAVISFWFNVL